MTRRGVLAFLAGFVLAAAIGVAVSLIWRVKAVTKVHVLEEPMLVASPQTSKNVHLLPKGTTLYFDRAYPEGFVRYKVYVNIDRLPLPLVDLPDPTLIDPIEAYKAGPAELRRLLDGYPISKDDLAAILKASGISKDEVRQLLSEYSR